MSKKYIYNQPKPDFFQKLLWSHFWIDFNKFYTKIFGIVYMLFAYLHPLLTWNPESAPGCYEWFFFVHNLTQQLIIEFGFYMSGFYMSDFYLCII
jgi:hypothetical protein